jgi:hypothetical protein
LFTFQVILVKSYLITSGALFGLIPLAHVWRIVEEGAWLMTEPSFVLTTLIAVAMSGWAFCLFRLSKHRGRQE